MKNDLYQTVTDKIIRQMQEGVMPWVQPWSTYGHTAALPQNAVSEKAYSGINVLLLWGSAIERGYTSSFWLTYKQAAALGGNIRKGERGTTVCYASKFIPKKEQARASRDGDDARSRAFLKRYSVFNATQCEGLDDRFFSDTELPERKSIERAEALITATEADFRIGGDRAFYVPSQDYVQVPPQPAFRDQVNYYGTCFHELGHWTGHTSRLNRDLKGGKRTSAYAREELVAEIAAAFVCASLSIEPTVRHADYIGSWIAVLKEDKRSIFRAASAAQKAADYILASQASVRLAA